MQSAGRRAEAPLVVSLGEVLWDRFPDRERLGGAPANMAVHAASLGARSALVSRVGDDAAGVEAVRQVASRGVDVRWVQVDERRETGVARVQVDASGEPAFEIVEGVAWDAIEWGDDLATLAGEADAVCFGTLAQRSETSRSTIYRFLDACRGDCIRFLDLNIRQHYHSRRVVQESLRRATALKVNRHELSFLAGVFDLKDEAPRVVEHLREALSIRYVALTLGAEGCMVWGDDGVLTASGERVEVADAVGAGDAFTAAFLVHLLDGVDLASAAAAANRLGAFVAGQDGAMPAIPRSFLVPRWDIHSA